MCRKDDDRLSSLPNNVLVTILSCLPTKSAISTSVLSRSWRYHWTRMTALRFRTSDFQVCMFNRSFFVTFRQISWQKINSLELIIAKSTSKCYIDRLVNDTVYVVPNVKELRVKSEIDGDLIHVQRCVFQKKSLEVLEMDGLMITNLGFNHSLPKLRKLVINVSVSDLKCLENLLKSFPLLEILRVGVYPTKILTHPIEIKFGNLKWFCLNFVGTYKVFGEGKKQVTIDAPNLEYLEVNSSVWMRFCFPNTPSKLSRAKLSMGEYSLREFISKGSLNPKQILMLLNPVFQVKTLSVCGDLILFALDFIDQNKMEMFRKLTRVEIKLGGYDVDYCTIGGARKFLKACPNLKSLVLSGKRVTLMQVKSLFAVLLETADVESTSSCVSECRRIRDMKLVGDFDRVKKNGKVMVQITIHVYRNNDRLIYYAKGFVRPNQL